MPEIGVIAIGRNEGDRLRRCLASLVGRGWPIVYVDSASTDGSPAAARELGAEVVDLDMSIPFSAARARNEGFARLLALAPDVTHVQFVDGDCEVVDGWISRAKQELDARPEAAVVCGRRRERFPEASVYNRIADVEWDTPVGEAKFCGGDAMYRVSAFKDVGGFDNTVAAGEEPELCQRLRGKGWKVFRVDAEMTVHDSAMLRLGQFWKRSVRSGYGAMDVAERFGQGQQKTFVGQVRSTTLWALYLPIAVIGFFTVLGPLGLLLLGGPGSVSPLSLIGSAVGGFGVGVAALVALYLLQIAKMTLRVRKRVKDGRTAAAYATLIMVGKFAQYAGQQQFRRDRKSGKLTRMIDYKSGGAAGTQSLTSTSARA